MKTLAILSALSCASLASAQFSSLGDLTFSGASGQFPTGLTGGINDSSTWHLWTFNANAGDMINVAVSRVGPSLDPMSATFVGNLDGQAYSVGVPLWDTATLAAQLGLPLAGSGDDDVDDSYGGPWGDPNYSFVASATGTYSILVGSYASLTTGEQRYDITVTGSTWVPAPGAMAVLGLGGLVASRRRR